MNEPAISVSDGWMRFQVGDTLIVLDPVETILKINEIGTATAGDEFSHFEWVVMFRDWIKEKSQITFTLGEADALRKAVLVERARTEKAFTNAVASQNSSEQSP